MNIFFPEHRLVLQSLQEHSVDFVLIGGFAVNYYGYNRVTGDMDLWLKPDNANKDRLLSALSRLGFDDEGISVIRSWDFNMPQRFYIGDKNRPDRTEFMTHISGITYETAKENLQIADLDGLLLPIISIAHLIQNKLTAGRLKDLADVEYLNKISILKQNN